MPIQIPPDVKVLRDPSLTAIKAITLLAKKDFLNVLKNEVKKAMKSKRAEFAESDYVVAQLRGGGERSEIDPKKLFALTQRKSSRIRNLTMEEFFGCIRVNVEAVEELLGAAEIEAISDRADGPSGSRLYTDWKSGLEIDLFRTMDALVGDIAQQANVQEKARAKATAARG